ncbi:MAG TPA: imidazole glycerol phosphate synthase subunit HisH [Gemmatimonadaceae bacterium]|nr:imidazole glycerol phosphate synthase subunit HisH [Gemmatimonadaceae bacterium]
MNEPRRVLRLTLFDYGAGNLHSLAKALASPGACVMVERDPCRATDARYTDVLVLPGVGAFPPAARELATGRSAMREALKAGLPTIGICLGMQLLFDESDEGAGAGLGIVPGRVTRLRAVRVPQIGWNAVEATGDAGSPFEDVPLPMAYYANSFVCRPDDDRSVLAWSEHEGDRFPAAVRAGPTGNVLGVQFHPEKSSTAGVRFLHACLARVRRRREVGE